MKRFSLNMRINIQLQIYKYLCNFASYLKQGQEKFNKKWNKPCPLCGAKDCAKFLTFYRRKRVYWNGRVYTNVLIIRFECNRLNPNVAVGSHRTFSLLPYPLIPYCPYPIPYILKIARILAENDDNAYQSVRTLEARYEQVNPEMGTIAWIGDLVHKSQDKLNRLSHQIRDRIGWRMPLSMPYRDQLSHFISFVTNYRSQQVAGSIATNRDLSYDYFHLFQQERPFMQRDFLFGTPSQRSC